MLLGATVGLAAMTAAYAEAGLTLKSVSVQLPVGDRTFPPGPDVDAINNNCLICHSAGMVLNQPALPKATWEAEVHKMIDAYKAPVQATDIPKIVEYLYQPA